ncbi:MAG: hypothetical protein CMP59_03265 [Flavobacteriales bacterium]|nr:hypothetical protein [Flavobacteriales bacterium]|tara:strand:- start:2845 stop:3549 length:705 start_codon:yes stop_codon:yes gene_type:complete
MRKLYSFVFLLCLAVSGLNAQKIAEFGPTVGRSYYLGEINPKTHIGNGVGSLSYGLIFRYNLNERWALKLNLNRATLTAEDESMDFLFNQSRLASFETKVTEITGNIEFNFLPFRIGTPNKSFSPYLFTGFSYFWYNPSTYIEGAEVVTSESADGNGLAFVFGPGIKTNIGKKFSIAVEWGFRKTGTDALDGLPNKIGELYELGKDYDNDWYVISGIMLTFKLTNEGPCPGLYF